MATLTYFINQEGDKLVKIRCKLVAGVNYREMAVTGFYVKPAHWPKWANLIEIKKEKQRNPNHKPKRNNKEPEVSKAAAASYRDKVNKGLRDLKAHILNELADVEGDPGNKWLADTINNFHNPGSVRGVDNSLFGFIQRFVDQAGNRRNKITGNRIDQKMISEYKVTFGYLKAYAAEKGKKIDFQHINMNFYNEWLSFLESKNLAKNTIGKKITVLKIFLNAADDEGYFNFKSKNFKAITEHSEKVYLNTDELKAIAEVELSSELDAIRDLFLIGCWTGLRFSDWNKFSQENIDNDMMIIRQQKTRHKVVIPVHTDVIKILEKRDGKLPKVPTNQHMNRSLKTIAEKAGITGKEQTTITRGGVERTTSHKKYELIGTHTARRSFATNMYRMGIPTITIMAITGHKTESSFLTYIRVTPEDHAKIIQDIWRKNVLKAV